MDEIEELGVRADHWCMYWRDSDETAEVRHRYEPHWKRGSVCKGCGAEEPKKKGKSDGKKA